MIPVLRRRADIRLCMGQYRARCSIRCWRTARLRSRDREARYLFSPCGRVLCEQRSAAHFLIPTVRRRTAAAGATLDQKGPLFFLRIVELRNQRVKTMYVQKHKKCASDSIRSTLRCSIAVLSNPGWAKRMIRRYCAHWLPITASGHTFASLVNRNDRQPTSPQVRGSQPGGPPDDKRMGAFVMTFRTLAYVLLVLTSLLLLGCPLSGTFRMSNTHCERCMEECQRLPYHTSQCQEGCKRSGACPRN